MEKEFFSEINPGKESEKSDLQMEKAVSLMNRNGFEIKDKDFERLVDPENPREIPYNKEVYPSVGSFINYLEKSPHSEELRGVLSREFKEEEIDAIFDKLKGEDKIVLKRLEI